MKSDNLKIISFLALAFSLIILTSCTGSVGGGGSYGNIQINICAEQFNAGVPVVGGESPEEIEQRCRYSSLDLSEIMALGWNVYFYYKKDGSTTTVVVRNNPEMIRNLGVGTYEVWAEIGVYGPDGRFYLLPGANDPLQIKVYKGKDTSVGMVWFGKFDSASYKGNLTIIKEEIPYFDLAFGNNEQSPDYIISQGRITGNAFQFDSPDNYKIIEGPADIYALNEIISNKDFSSCEEEGNCYSCGSFVYCNSSLDTELNYGLYDITVNTTSLMHDRYDADRSNNIISYQLNHCLRSPENFIILEKDLVELNVDEHPLSPYANDKVIAWTIKDNSTMLHYDISNIRFECPAGWTCELVGQGSFTIHPGESKMIMQKLSFGDHCPDNKEGYNTRISFSLKDKSGAGCRMSFDKEFEAVIKTNVSEKCKCEDFLSGLQLSCDQSGERGCWAYGNCCGDEPGENWVFVVVDKIDDMILSNTCFNGEWYNVESEKITYYDLKGPEAGEVGKDG